TWLRADLAHNWPSVMPASLKIRGVHRLDHFRTGGVGGPDISLWIDADGLRHDVYALTPGAKDTAFAVQGDDRVGLIAALKEVNDAVAIRGDPGHHTQPPPIARGLDSKRSTFQIEPGRLRDQGT